MPNFPSREELLGSLPGPIPVQDQMSGTGPDGRTIYCYKELLEYPLVISHQSGTVLTKKIKELLLLFLVDDQFCLWSMLECYWTWCYRAKSWLERIVTVRKWKSNVRCIVVLTESPVLAHRMHSSWVCFGDVNLTQCNLQTLFIYFSQMLQSCIYEETLWFIVQDILMSF